MSLANRAVTFLFGSALYLASVTIGPFFRAYERLKIRQLPRNPEELARRIVENIALLVPLLKRYGAGAGWDKELTEHQQLLRKSDYSRVSNLVRSFGGVGRLDDIIICVSNGHKIQEDDEEEVNMELGGLVEELSLLARALETVLPDNKRRNA